jgi:DNA topoisomerase VI subunit B
MDRRWARKLSRAKTSTARNRVTSSSTAEYFSKNLQQVGFSSPTKAVLTTLKEAFDNALDACEDSGILPDIEVIVEKNGPGAMKNTDMIMVRVTDNGPGISITDIPRVFGEYLASSKFGRGRCSRGQQGIGISAATTWSLQTAALGARVISKADGQKKALSCVVTIDLKNNRGVMQDKQMIDWDREHGTSVEFVFDGRVQLNGEAGLINYIKGNVLVNPHLSLTYKLLDEAKQRVERVSDELVRIPEPTAPHPHTMKLGEFISHAKLFGKAKTRLFLKTGFSRLSDKVIMGLPKIGGFPKGTLDKTLGYLSPEDFSKIYRSLQNADLRAPSTDSVVSIGEDALAKSIRRLGDIDYFSVITRKPTICDFKPVQVEIALARLNKSKGDFDAPVQILRFANRVPLQFDKAGCAIVKAMTSVNWRSYGLKQPKDALPQGPFIMAVSVVSPFIKFKNASKETIDTSDELVEEIRRALMQAGQKLSRHLRQETKAQELEEKIQYIEKFAPILVSGLVRITKSAQKRGTNATEGLMKILGRDTKVTAAQLKEAERKLGNLIAQDTSYQEAGKLTDEELEESAAPRDSGETKTTAKKSSVTKTSIKKTSASKNKHRNDTAKKATTRALKKNQKKSSGKAVEKTVKKTIKKTAKKTTKKASKKTTKKASKKTTKKASKKTTKKASKKTTKKTTMKR